MPKRERTKLKYIWKVNGIYHFRDTINGARHEESLKTTDWSTAVDRANDIRMKFDPAIARSSKIRFCDIAQPFIDYQNDRFKNEKIREGTLREFKYQINKKILPELQFESVRGFTEERWAEILSDMKTRPENTKKVLYSFLKFAKKRGIISEIPQLEFIKKPRREGIALTDDEIGAIWKHLNENAKLYFVMSLTMAMRRKEILSLPWSAVDFKNRSIYLPETATKTKKPRVIPISDEAFKMLRDRRNCTVGGFWVFPNAWDPKEHGSMSYVRRSIRKAKALAQIDLPESRDRLKHFVPHDLRRTWESRAHLRTDFTNTQLEKFAGSSVKVQKDIYVKLEADKLRSLANTVQVPGLKKSLGLKSIRRGKTGEKSK